MDQHAGVSEAATIVDRIITEVSTRPAQNTANVREVRRKYSKALSKASPELLFQVAKLLCKRDEQRWIAYELILGHPAAFKRIDLEKLEELGCGNHSWWTVDSFARTLSGPAWLQGQISDENILKWADSSERWWRRAALVSTVALNVRSLGGNGDARRTLLVCRKLADDQDEMVAKALSWALRELVCHDPEAVQEFLREHDRVLAARVKREVRNKLETGLKNPARSEP